MISIDTLAGPARDCAVPRDLRSQLWPREQPEKPLWRWDEAFHAIAALEDAGAAVVQGEILAVGGDGAVSRVPWEPSLPPGPDPRFPCTWRDWRWTRAADEPWREFVARAAAYARTRLRGLAGGAHTPPADALRVDLAWVTEDELALWDQPGWVRKWRRRLVEQGGGNLSTWRSPSVRMHGVGEPAPGSYYGTLAQDVDEVPPGARYAMLMLQETGAARLADRGALEVLWAAGCTDRALADIGRLGRLRELCVMDELHLGDLREPSVLDPLARLRGLELALLAVESPVTDVRPLATLPRLRYLRLEATGLRDLEGMRALTQLNSLHLIPAEEVDSLAPLASLVHLRHLSVLMDAVRHGGLAPLESMRWLRSLHLHSDEFPLGEIARLAVALPHVEGPHRAPFLPADHPIRPEPCPRCGREDTFVTVGKPLRRICPACGARKLRRHVVRWEVLLSAAAAERRAAGS